MITKTTETALTGTGVEKKKKYLPETEEYMETVKRLSAQKEQNTVDAAQQQYESLLKSANNTYDANWKQRQEDYKNAVLRQARIMKDEQRTANIQTARVEKLMPYYQQSQGLTGGMSQSDWINAYLAADKRRQEAGRTYADNVAGLDQERTRAETDATMRRDQAYEDAKQFLIEKRLEAQQRRLDEEAAGYADGYEKWYTDEVRRQLREQQVDDMKLSRQQQIEDRDYEQKLISNAQYIEDIDDMVTQFVKDQEGNGGKVSAKNFDAYIDQIRNTETYKNLSDEGKERVESRISSYKTQEVDNVPDKARVGQISDTGKSGEYVSGDHNGKLSKGDRFTVKVGDTKYEIRSEGEVEAGLRKEILNRFGNLRLQDRKVFVYNKEPYIIYNGKIYLIGAQVDSNNNGHEIKQYNGLLEALGIELEQ